MGEQVIAPRYAGLTAGHRPEKLEPPVPSCPRFEPGRGGLYLKRRREGRDRASVGPPESRQLRLRLPIADHHHLGWPRLHRDHLEGLVVRQEPAAHAFGRRQVAALFEPHHNRGEVACRAAHETSPQDALHRRMEGAGELQLGAKEVELLGVVGGELDRPRVVDRQGPAVEADRHRSRLGAGEALPGEAGEAAAATVAALKDHPSLDRWARQVDRLTNAADLLQVPAEGHRLQMMGPQFRAEITE